MQERDEKALLKLYFWLICAGILLISLAFWGLNNLSTHQATQILEFEHNEELIHVALKKTQEIKENLAILKHVQMETIHLQNQMSVVMTQSLPKAGTKPKVLNVCLGNAGNHGIGSALTIYAVHLNLSMTLGFKLHLENFFPDGNYQFKDMYLQHVFPLASFHPPQCDVFYSFPFQNCLNLSIFFGHLAFHLYHTQLYLFYAKFYSPVLQEFATHVFANFSLNVHRVVGVQVRGDFNVLDDGRGIRKVTPEDYLLFKEYIENVESEDKDSTANNNVLYLAMGDGALHSFPGENVVFLEEYLEANYPFLTRLQRLFVSIDIMSRTRFRIISKFTNNWPLHMAFHRLNGNIDNVYAADVYSMIVYNYFGDQIVKFKDIPLDNPPLNPYTFSPDPVATQNFIEDCHRNLYFGATPPQAEMGGGLDVLKYWEDNEKGKPIGEPPESRHPTGFY